jgi:peptidoglycan DL-endopeptidase CwlO
VRRLRAGGSGESGNSAGTGSAGRGSVGRGGTRKIAAAGVALAIVGGIVAVSQGAGAAPKPTIAQVQAQINSLQAQIDQTGQQYDAVNQQVAAGKLQLAAVQKQAANAQGKYNTARSKLRQIAVAAYETANQSSIAALLTSADPTQVLAQASLIEDLGNQDNTQVTIFLTAAQRAAASQGNVQRAQQGLDQLQSQLATKKQHLDSLLSQDNTLLSNMNNAAIAASAVGGPPGTFITSATYTGPTSTAAGKAVQFVYEQLGKPYLWGGTGPSSYDCSGLVQAAWAAAGVSIPRTTGEQVVALPSIPRSALAPGDLIYFNGATHVAMYVGNGMIIDAPRTGEVIRMLPLATDWYSANYYSSARP